MMLTDAVMTSVEHPQTAVVTITDDEDGRFICCAHYLIGASHHLCIIFETNLGYCHKCLFKSHYKSISNVRLSPVLFY